MQNNFANGHQKTWISKKSLYSSIAKLRNSIAKQRTLMVRDSFP